MRVLEAQRRDRDPLRRRLRASRSKAVEEPQRGGDPYDWFFFVDGVESPVGAAEYPLQRRRADLVGLPRLEGDQPRPGRGRLLAGAVCRRLRRRSAPGRGRMRGSGAGTACARGASGARGRRGEAGAAARRRAAIRVLVGPWGRLRVGPGRGAARSAARRQAASTPSSSRRRAATRCSASTRTARWRAASAPTPAWSRRRAARRAAGLAGHRRHARPACRPPPSCSTRDDLRDHYAVAPRGRRGGAAAGRDEIAVRLHAAAGAAAGGLARRRRRLPRRAGRRRLPLLEPAGAARRRRRGGRWPACSPGRGGAVRAALRMGLALALPIVVVNALVVDRGETVLARLGDWPLLGQVDVTLEALAAGAVIGLRAVVGDDRLRRLLGLRRPRPGAAGAASAGRALGADRDPGLAAGPGRGRRRGAAARRRARCAGPAPPRSGEAPLARRLLAGSLDRAVDVAATLELRGYSLERAAGAGRRRASRSRYDRRFYLAAAVVLAAAVAGKLARRRRVPHLPDDRGRAERADRGARGAGRGQRPGAAAAAARRRARRRGDRPRAAAPALEAGRV